MSTLTLAPSASTNKEQFSEAASTEKRETRPQLDALTFLRFVGAAAVVVHHSINTFHLSPDIENWNITATLSFFFILSGFILAYTHSRFEQRSDFTRFFRARFARAWPLHLATFLMFALFVKDGAGYDENANPRLDVVLAQIFLLQAWVPDPFFFFSFDSPSWSISVECLFYLCFPFIQVWRHKQGLLRGFVLVAISAGIAACCTAVGAHSSVPEFKTWVTWINPLSHLFEFTLGIFCSTLFFRWRRFDKKSIATVAQVVTIALGALFFSHFNEIRQAMSGFPIQVPFGLFCATVVLSFSMGSGLIARAISNKVCVKLGEMSYCIYLLHSLISTAFRSQWEHLAQTQGIVSFVAYASCVLIASYLCHEYYEAPMRKLIIGKRKAPKIVAAAAN